MKLGQMLALRYDLLPAAYCDELFRLLNQVAPFSYDEVREIIRQELGARARGRVRRRSSEPSFAAASIGQVHRASLHNGDRVAVKVQRPRIRETLQADIELMYSVTWLLDWTAAVRRHEEPRGHRRVRALDRGRGRLPRRGPPGRASSASTRRATGTSASPASTATTRRRAS